MQMAVANALLTANEVTEAVKWAKSASLVGAPEADKLPFAAFQDSRQFRPCDLQVCVCVCVCVCLCLSVSLSV